MDLYYANPAQHITTAGDELDDLDDVDDLSEVWYVVLALIFCSGPRCFPPASARRWTKGAVYLPQEVRTAQQETPPGVRRRPRDEAQQAC